MLYDPGVLGTLISDRFEFPLFWHSNWNYELSPQVQLLFVLGLHLAHLTS